MHFTQFFHTKYTSYTAVCYDNDVNDITAPHVYVTQELQIHQMQWRQKPNAKRRHHVGGIRSANRKWFNMRNMKIIMLRLIADRMFRVPLVYNTIYTSSQAWAVNDVTLLVYNVCTLQTKLLLIGWRNTAHRSIRNIKLHHCCNMLYLQNGGCSYCRQWRHCHPVYTPRSLDNSQTSQLAVSQVADWSGRELSTRWHHGSYICRLHQA